MKSSALTWGAAWLATLAVGALLITSRLSISVDLAYFLPAPKSLGGEMLVRNLGQGPGSQLLFVGISNASETDIAKFATELRKTPQFTQIVSGDDVFDFNDLPQSVHENRYLLADIDWSSNALASVLEARLADLAFLDADEGLQLLSEDPHLITLRLLESLQTAATPQWLSDDGSTRFLIAEARAPAFDMEGQSAALRKLKLLATKLGLRLDNISGAGVYGVELGQTIRAESQWRSLAASLLILVVLVLAYRSWREPLLAALPLLTGGIAGLAALTLAFQQVHGITLAFGFTLLGVAVDYPVHALSHARRLPGKRAIQDVWPTLRLGAFSTIVAYAAFGLSGSKGLLQLGVFSGVGLLFAAIATRYLLPRLMSDETIQSRSSTQAISSGSPMLRNGLWVVVGLAAIALLSIRGEGLWNSDLSSLTPIDPARLARDVQQRQKMGAPDLRYLMAAHGGTLQEALVNAERLEGTLARLVSEGAIGSFNRSSRLLPSDSLQHQRRAALPPSAVLAERLTNAAETLPFRSDAFEPMIKAVEQHQAQNEPIRIEHYLGTPLAELMESAAYVLGDRWVAPIALYDIRDTLRIRESLSASGHSGVLIDLKSTSDELVADYRRQTVGTLLIALALISAALIWRVGANRRTIWVLGTLATSISATLAGSALILGQLTLFNLVATVLVAGLGLDYALFLSRNEQNAQATVDTRHAVLVCAISTLGAFGILALSSLPILRSIGVTVALGVMINWSLGWFGAHRPAMQPTER